MMNGEDLSPMVYEYSPVESSLTILGDNEAVEDPSLHSPYEIEIVYAKQ